MIDGVKNPKTNAGAPSGWAFVGFCEKGRGRKRHEVMIPIGVFTTYALGKLSANAWMKTATTPVRWEGERLYEDCECSNLR